MSLELNLYALAVFEVVNYDLTSLFGAHADSVSVGAERNRGQGRLYVYLLDLFPLDDVVEKDTSIKAGGAQEEVVDGGEGYARANIVMRLELESERVCGLERCLTRIAASFVLLDDRL